MHPHKGLYVPNSHRDQQTGSQIDKPVSIGTKAENRIQHCGERKTGYDGQRTQNGIHLDMFFRRLIFFEWF